MAPVLSATVASMRPEDTCADDGAAKPASIKTAVDNTIGLANRTPIFILQEKSESKAQKRTVYKREHITMQFPSTRKARNSCKRFQSLTAVPMVQLIVRIRACECRVQQVVWKN